MKSIAVFFISFRAVLSSLALYSLIFIISGLFTSCSPERYTNSVGMEMVLIKSGSYDRGCEESNEALFYNERPVHNVTISRSFYMSSTPVTNAQYEQFDPEHRQYRGKWGFSKEDDEAVIFVSWEDAVAFTEWLSEKEGKPYRLPTEAEWEYASRAGTRTAYFTGDTLPAEFHRHQYDEVRPEPVDLQVGMTPVNPWGLYDIHGLVEEWTIDWYGPYVEGDQTDPTGYADGDVKVTRGGSHNTAVQYLRSANRMGTVTESRNWLIGFRVVQGRMPATEPLPVPEPPLWAQDVSPVEFDWSEGPDPDMPYFNGPRAYISMPDEPPYNHYYTHCPALAVLNNGDLLAIWHAMSTERGRELVIVGARLRSGEEEWEMASEFFLAPDRNLHGPDLFVDDDGTLFHFNGLSASAEIHHILALLMRKSTDNGATWSKPRLIGPEYHSRHQIIDGSFKTRDGAIVITSDSNPGGTALYFSKDGGETWTDPGGTIRGKHAGVVELKDGRLLAIGRRENIEGRSPMSISDDRGKTWSYSASPFPPFSGGQRGSMIRLKEGPILYVSFTDFRNSPRETGMIFTDKNGNNFRGHGLFAALSFDEGKTWPTRKLITPADNKEYFARHHSRGPSAPFTATYDNAENGGYMAVRQAPNGVIHLISSRLHYEFNLSWLIQPPVISE